VSGVKTQKIKKKRLKIMKKSPFELLHTHCKMTVKIVSPNTSTGLLVEKCLKYCCTFYYDSEQYGNGFYLTITNEHGDYFHGFDLRYDRTFKKAEKKKWLEKWAKNYWNGENGAWLFKSLEITEE
jgi:hypothetical protein